MEDFAVKVENLSKDFILPHKKRGTLKSFFLSPFVKYDKQKQHALGDINFEVKKGEFFGIVGRNGSGKSTLLKCLAGVYYPDRGNIDIRGSLIPFIELGVGFNPELSGRDNVFLNGALLGFSRKEVESMYQEVVDFAELEEFMDQKLKNYSSGMQVRLAFSIAIQAKGEILLLDEVLAVGDSAFQQKCYTYFEGLKDSNRTVIFVSHDMAAVKRFCSKALLLTKGELVHIGSSLEIADKYTEANIESPGKNDSGKQKKEKNFIRQKIIEENDKNLKLEFSYKSDLKENLYIGLSILYNGTSVAEINTIDSLELIQNGKVNFTIDKKLFNSGVYYITCVLCKQKGKKLLAIGNNKLNFIVKGEDINRGGPIKLVNEWETA